MLVIFEGVDGSGKSTVIKDLKEKFGWEEIEWPGKQSNPSAFILMVDKFIQNNSKRITNNKIYLMDRAGFGELIYGTIENRLSTTYPGSYNKYWEFLKNCMLVLCYNEKAHKNAITRGEEGIAKDECIHGVISLAYAEIYADLMDKVMAATVYDYTEKCPAELAAEIVAANFRRITLVGTKDGRN